MNDIEDKLLNLKITKSEKQSKEWRKKQVWYKNGKHNECEKYQIEIIEKITQKKINKTDERINAENCQIVINKYPIKHDDGYEYTENFDGIIIHHKKYYFNLKFVCDSGGAQTRTLREVYNFIKLQLEYLITSKTTKIYFINILDGNTSFNNINKFNYLLNKEKYKNVKKNVFIGDMKQFKNFWITLT
jgi:hypothetical protein